MSKEGERTTYEAPKHNPEEIENFRCCRSRCRDTVTDVSAQLVTNFLEHKLVPDGVSGCDAPEISLTIQQARAQFTNCAWKVFVHLDECKL